MTKRRKSINGKRVTISDPKVTIDALKVLKSKKPTFLLGDTLLLPANKKSKSPPPPPEAKFSFKLKKTRALCGSKTAVVLECSIFMK